MLITICYSVLTWIQSRQRTEISGWVQECCVKEKASIVFVRDRILFISDNSGTSGESVVGMSGSGGGLGSSTSGFAQASRSASTSSFGESPSRNISRSSSVTNSNFSSPRRDIWTSSNRSFSGSTRQISELCYNHNSIKIRRLLWEEDRTRALVLSPQQVVELHDWTAFIGTQIDSESLREDEGVKKFYILLEAEPGSTQRQEYRKFWQFGHITAWKCGSELALILHSDLGQVIELMHIFRLGQIVLEGGWHVYRLTTVRCEGAIGTLISRCQILNSKTSLTPGDLRRLSAGIYENRDTQASQSQISQTITTRVGLSLSHDASRHDITTINEEVLSEESENGIVKRLPNWYDRSPKKRYDQKRSVATLPALNRSSVARRRVSSFCSGSLSALTNRSPSLASLLCSKSMSVDEEDLTTMTTIQQYGHELMVSGRKPTTLDTHGSGSKSYESLTSTPTDTPSQLQSPTTNLAKPIVSMQQSLSPSPKKSGGGGMTMKKSPNRSGKPPNILVLCDCDKRREQIANVLKTMLANDRYAIYDIRWDQLIVGGWSDQTALLVVSGKIPDTSHSTTLLQFLGDGGRLFAWCCETHPFGPSNCSSNYNSIPAKLTEKQRKIIQYGTSQSITHPLVISNVTWGKAPESKDNYPPSDFQRVLESNDSEGYSRPLTVSVFGKVKGTNDTAIIQLDGGALGGKAILSRIHFEECMDEDSSLALLSLLLSQNLGIDCTRIKAPEYTTGYLLGDHTKIMQFLTDTPSTIQQADLTVEFIPRGEKGSLPSHLRFPVRSLECPPNFSTLEYFDNLTTKELGRLVIYTDTITSTMHVLNGHSLRHGLVVIARRQTTGKGRGKNVWLSPEGCACFAVQLNLHMDSHMGRRISLFQHISALAVILAVPNHKEINLRVKWPNDIYLGEQKIGGVLVETRLEGKNAIVNLGIGVNVSNAYPTVCLNSVLFPNINSTGYGKKEKPLTCEKLIATTLSELEKLLNLIEAEPLERILNLYTENWIHNMEENDDVVNVEISEGRFTECSISGIDEFGFLRVNEVGTGQVFSVRPDGNSFDIANSLIAIKD